MESKQKTVLLEYFLPMNPQGGRRSQFSENVEPADIEKQIRDVELGSSGQMSMTKGGA
jgi:hypothetical protein